MERSEIQCQCEDCGKKFRKGEEGDNERFCLRCEHLSLTDGMDELDREYYDQMREE